VSTNISEEEVAYIFRLEESPLKKEAEGSSEMLVPFYRITLCHISDGTLYYMCCLISLKYFCIIFPFTFCFVFLTEAYKMGCNGLN
jgi:hypothetical protein